MSCGRMKRSWDPAEMMHRTCRAQSLHDSGSATARQASRGRPRRSTATGTSSDLIKELVKILHYIYLFSIPPDTSKRERRGLLTARDCITGACD